MTYLRSLLDRSPLLLMIDPDVRMGTADAAAFAERFLSNFLIIQLIVVVVITPVLAGGAITDEKERRTLDFRLASPLMSLDIVMGKMAARMVSVGGGHRVAGPRDTILFGGVDVRQLLAGYAITAMTMLSLGALSLYTAVVTDALASVLWRVYSLIVGITVFGCCEGALFFPALASPFPTLLPWPWGEPSQEAPPPTRQQRIPRLCKGKTHCSFQSNGL